MGKMTLDQGVMKRSIKHTPNKNQGKVHPPGRVIIPGPGPQKASFSIGRLESIFKGQDKPNFCIIRSLGGIGDVLMTTPLCRGLKRKWPGCTVTYATDMDYMNGSLPDILKYNPYIDEIIPHQILKGKRFDAIADVTSVCTKYEKKENPPVNRVDLFSHASGIPLFGDKLPTYIVTDEEKAWAQTFLQKYTKPGIPIKWVGIQARSNSERRNWPIENVKLLATKLEKTQGIKVVVFDHKKEELWNIAGIIPVIDFKIRQVGALVDAMDIMICPDSGILHLAGALEKRIIALFGSSDPRARVNYYQNAITIEEDKLQCLHCWYASCAYKHACMKNITVDTVYQKTMTQLKTDEIRGNQINVSAPGDNAIILKRDFGGIGDMIMITPILKGLRERFKNKQIHLMIPDSYREIFNHNPNVDKIIPTNNTIYKCYEFKYDISSVCAKYEHNALITTKVVDKSRVEIFCDAAGVNPSKYRPELFLSNDEKDWAKKFMTPYMNNIIIATGLRSAESYRNWPIKYYEEVFKVFEKTHPHIKFLILDQERVWDFPGDNIIDGAGFPFRKFLSLVYRCHLVLTPDTSLLHVGGAMNKKMIALFGPIEAGVRCNFYPKATVITDKSLDCVPCWRNAHMPCRVNNDLDESVCMVNISPDTVIKKIIEIIKGSINDNKNTRRR